MDVRLGDTLVMKKAHPCGSKEWKVLRTGMDFRLKCLGCGHEVRAPAPSWNGILRRSAMQRNEPLGQAKALLYEHFGYSSFRGAQETLISAILSGKDAGHSCLRGRQVHLLSGSGADAPGDHAGGVAADFTHAGSGAGR